jgi:hypothetical protein
MDSEEDIYLFINSFNDDDDDTTKDILDRFHIDYYYDEGIAFYFNLSSKLLYLQVKQKLAEYGIIVYQDEGIKMS